MSDLADRLISRKTMMVLVILLALLAVVTQSNSYRYRIKNSTSNNQSATRPITSVSEQKSQEPTVTTYDFEANEQRDRIEVLNALKNYSGLNRDAAEQRLVQAEEAAKRYGLPAWVGQYMAEEAAIMAKTKKDDRKKGGYYYAIPDELDLQNNMILNFFQSAKTLSGTRILLLEQLMQYRDKIGQEFEMRETFSKKIASGAGIDALDQYIKIEFGISAPQAIQSMGGVSGILQGIDPRRRHYLISFVMDPEHLANTPKTMLPEGVN